MEKVRQWCGQPSDRGRLRNRNRKREVVSEQCSVSTVDDIDTGRLTQVIESIEFIHLNHHHHLFAQYAEINSKLCKCAGENVQYRYLQTSLPEYSYYRT